MYRRGRNGRVLRQTAVDGEANVRMTGLALSVIQTKRVHPLTAAIARAAADVALDADACAWCERHAVAGRHDLAAELMPGDMRELRGRELPRKDLLIGGAHHRRTHPDQGFAARRAWRGHVGDGERSGALEHDGAHTRGETHGC